jgi:hypothetical protein
MGCAEPKAVDVRIGSRGAERVRLFATADVRTERGNCSVIVRDLSATGAGVEAQTVQFEQGDVIRLRLPLLPAEQRGEIVWSAGASAGIRFCAPLDLLTFRLVARAMGASDSEQELAPATAAAQLGREPAASERKRRAERADVAIGANCRTAAGRRGFVAMIDLTAEGCCLFGRDLALAAGQQLTLQPETLGALKATVQWSKGALTGVLFDHALYPSVFAHLASTYRWPISEPAKLALAPDGHISQAAQRELVRMIDRAEKSFNARNAQRDILTTRPPLIGSRPGLAPQGPNGKPGQFHFR